MPACLVALVTQLVSLNSPPHCQVLGLPQGADSNAVQRAYRRKLSEVKGDEAAKQRIEVGGCRPPPPAPPARPPPDTSPLKRVQAAHSALVMSALTSRLKGGVSVEKDVLYAGGVGVG